MLLRFTYGIGRVSVDLESLSLGTPSVAMNNFRWNVCNVARLEDPPPSFDSVLLRIGRRFPIPGRETRHIRLVSALGRVEKNVGDPPLKLFSRFLCLLYFLAFFFF